MGYLAYLIALLKMLFTETGNLSPNQGVRQFLTYAEGLNHLFVWICLGIWFVALFIVLAFVFTNRRDFQLTGCVSGCQAFFVVLLPLVQWVIWRLNVGMLNTFSAAVGVTDVKFWIYVLITFFLGTG